MAQAASTAMAETDPATGDGQAPAAPRLKVESSRSRGDMTEYAVAQTKALAGAAAAHQRSTEDFLDEPYIFAQSPMVNKLSFQEAQAVKRYQRKPANLGSDSYQTAESLPSDLVGKAAETLFAAYVSHERGPENNALEHARDDGLTLSDDIRKHADVKQTHEDEFDEDTGEHPVLDTGIGKPFTWKSPASGVQAPPKMSTSLRRLSKPISPPYYVSKEFCDLHYNPANRPPVLEREGFVPIMQAASVDRQLQRDVTQSLIVLSAQGDENKLTFGEAGFTEELLNLVESKDMAVRCNAVQSLANLMSKEENRRDFFALPKSVERFTRLSYAKVREGTRVQPATVRAMRPAAEAIAQLAHSETREIKEKFMQSGLLFALATLCRSKDKETRHIAARGLLWLCRKPGSTTDKWQRPGEITDISWTSEQLHVLVSAADSDDPHVVMQVLLGIRSVCTPSFVSIMLVRTNILRILCKAMKGRLFEENFPLLMAALLVLSALSQSIWPKPVLESKDFIRIVVHLLNLLPATHEQVTSMQSAKGVMSTWDEATLASKASILTRCPEATMGMVSEVFPQSFRQLQCYVLIADVLEVMERLMLSMTPFRETLFYHGAAQQFVTLHIYTRYKVPQITCLRLLCLMVGSEKLAHDVSKNARLLEIIDFALRYEDNSSLPRTSVISIKELSKDKACVESLIQMGLVQALGHLTTTNDPHMQINLLNCLLNLATNLHAKEQICQLEQWPRLIRWADSFDPLVREATGLMFSQICAGADSEICRAALEPVVKELKFLLRANRIDPLVAQTVIDYVNETRKVVKAQCLFRGVIARRRTRKIKQDALMRGEKPPESAVQKAIHIFSPAGEMKDRESAAKP